jgi:hypothetical protein
VPRYAIETIGSGRETIEAGCVTASAEWIIFYFGLEPSPTEVVAAFPTQQVFRVIPG